MRRRRRDWCTRDLGRLRLLQFYGPIKDYIEVIGRLSCDERFLLRILEVTFYFYLTFYFLFLRYKEHS